MILVFTDENNRVIYSYTEYSQLNNEFKSQGIEVPDTAFNGRPEVNPWEQVIPYLVDGDIVWSVEELPKDSPEYAWKKLAQYEAAGEHSFVNPI